MLKGIGASIALPFLEAMVPSSILYDPIMTAPKRAAFMFAPNGVCPGKWAPDEVGTNFKLSPILQPLAGLEKNMLVLQQLMNKNSISRLDGHYTKTANFLTSMPITRTIGSKVNSGGISIDQMIAQKLAKETLFPSLVYGIDRIKSGVDSAVGFTRLYGASISWDVPTRPCAKEIEPRFAFDRLFRTIVPKKNAKPENPYKKSILDAVSEDAKSLQKKLGIADQNKLAEYLESIRSVEMRLGNKVQMKDFEASISPSLKKELDRLDIRIDEYVDLEKGLDVTEKVRLMFDIMILAFWSDASRVGSFMFGNSVSSRNFSFLDGVRANFHSLSHHQNDERRMVQYERINKWHIEQVAYFLNKMKSIPEGNSNMLDNSMVMFGSGLSDGNRHSPYNLPILLAGGGGGKIKGGQNLVFEKNTPLANLYLTMGQIMGLEMDCFADANSIIPEILA